MNATTSQVRRVVTVLSALVMVIGIGAVVQNVEPTEASWAEQVHGTSQFGMANIHAGNRFARAMSTYGFMDRAAKDHNVGPVSALRVSTDKEPRAITGPSTHSSSGAFPLYLLHLNTVGFSCSTVDVKKAECANGVPENFSNPTASAVSETQNLEVRTAFVGLDLVTYQNSTPIRATATCSPARGAATMTSAGSIILGRDTLLSDQIEVPVPGPNAESSNNRSWGSYDYTATMQHVRKEEPGYAMSQLRLRVNATGTDGAERWNLTLILAHAECGVDRALTDSPTRPTTGAWPALNARSSRISTPMAQQSAGRQPLVDQADGAEARAESESSESGLNNDPLDSVDTSLPTLADGARGDLADAMPTGTSAPVPSVTNAPLSGVQEPPAPTSPSSPSESAPPEAAAPTEGPQDPEQVRVGCEFAVVTRNGVELGTARIDDIVRTPGCGVELTLTIRTSAEAGPDRWASIGPGDFAEVRPGGSIRKAGRVSSDCERSANSRVTALSAGREYEFVIAIALDDSAQRAMLRPDSTAGWVFDLPPLPKDAATTSQAPATNASPTPDASEPSVETSVNTAEA